MTYVWMEDDNDLNVKEMSISTPIEGGGSITTKIEVGTNDETIGQSYVYVQDEVFNNWYDPSGNNLFKFYLYLRDWNIGI